MPSPKEPKISLIVPVINEEKSLPAFLESLKKKKDIDFELLFCDGGSTDQTLSLLNSQKSVFMLRILTGEKGRGRQMNTGAEHARSPNLLFLHADSIFPEPTALCKAVNTFECKINQKGHEKVAGHFPLRFLQSKSSPSLAYYYYEFKTQLNRPGCINGDQGLLIRRSFFLELGGFDETFGFLEDDLIARAIFRRGEWLLLPGEILTSARRFESEGLYERQVLNALIMNFSNIGWKPFFYKAHDVYREQKDNNRLNLRPFFQTIAALLKKESFQKKLSLWYHTGAYVNQNAWQMAFFLDVLNLFKGGRQKRGCPNPRLNFFDNHLKLLTQHPPGFAATGALTWIWFHSYRIWMWFKNLFGELIFRIR